MNKWIKEGFLGSVNKVSLPAFEFCLWGKTHKSLLVRHLELLTIGPIRSGICGI